MLIRIYCNSCQNIYILILWIPIYFFVMNVFFYTGGQPVSSRSQRQTGGEKDDTDHFASNSSTPEFVSMDNEENNSEHLVMYEGKTIYVKYFLRPDK